MAVFELGVDDWEAAFDRFLTEILPVAATTEDALTDAPGLLWRVAITAPATVALPWQPLGRTARDSMREIHEPFVELHKLLAFAGARDHDSIDAWMRLHARQIRSQRERLVVDAGRALRAFVESDYTAAAFELERIAPLMPQVGGSRAQNELFRDLAKFCQRRAEECDVTIRH